MGHAVRIAITPGSHGTRVFLDEVEIKELVGIVVTAAVEEPSKVHLTFRALSVEIVGEIGYVYRHSAASR